MEIRDDDTIPGSGPKLGRPRSTTAKSTTKKVVPSLTDSQLKESIEQTLLFVSMGVGLVDKGCTERKMVAPEYVETCSEAVANQASVVADALVDASKKNPALRRILNTMAATSVLGQLATALMPLTISIARNHVSALMIDLPIQGDANPNVVYPQAV